MRRADCLEVSTDFDAELLVHERRSVEVVEDDEHAAVTEDDGHRTLVDIARVRGDLWVE